MNVVVVTGTPGTGKTVIAKRLAKQKGFLYIDVKKLVKNFTLGTSYDKKRKSIVVDLKKLNKVLINIIEISKENKVKGLVIDSHLAHFLPRKYVDLCIVTRTNTKKLYSRLKKRGYSKSKIDENMEAEIMEVILDEARRMKHKIKIIKN
ncbi:adenylate kinase family protein [Candidatus Woesearchaeota archaeon]|nr:adenylate kinase family protein [Candidatus Woesearchaeota archaeon]